jgi:hypothetical protein
VVTVTVSFTAATGGSGYRAMVAGLIFDNVEAQIVVVHKSQ